MSLTIIFEVEAKDGMFEALKEMFFATLPDTHSYDGCIGAVAHTDQDRPNVIFLIEEWASREAYDQYLAWRRETGAMEVLAGMLCKPPVIRFLNKL